MNSIMAPVRYSFDKAFTELPPSAGWQPCFLGRTQLWVSCKTD